MKTLSKYSNIEKSASLHCRLATACAVVLLAFSVAPRAQGATITDNNQGRYDLNNQASGANGPLANYIVGTQNGIPDPSANPPYPGFSYNFADFFAFNLAGIVPGSITSATITLSGGQNVFDSGPNGVFKLYASPVDPSTNGSGFTADLATDDLIGSVSVTNGGSIGFSNPVPSNITLTLNAAGLRDINAATTAPGQDFFVGGTFTGAAPYVLLPGPGGLTFANLFNGSGNTSGGILAVTAESVPEPSTLTLGLVFVGFLACSRMRALVRI